MKGRVLALSLQGFYWNLDKLVVFGIFSGANTQVDQQKIFANDRLSFQFKQRVQLNTGVAHEPVQQAEQKQIFQNQKQINAVVSEGSLPVASLEQAFQLLYLIFLLQDLIIEMLDVRLFLFVDAIIKGIANKVPNFKFIVLCVEEALAHQILQLDVLVVAPGLARLKVGARLPQHALVRIFPVHQLDLVFVDGALMDAGDHLDEDGQVVALRGFVAVGVDLQSPLRAFAFFGWAVDGASIFFLPAKIADHEPTVKIWRNHLLQYTFSLSFDTRQLYFELRLYFLDETLLKSECAGLLGLLSFGDQLLLQLIQRLYDFVVFINGLLDLIGLFSRLLDDLNSIVLSVLFKLLQVLLFQLLELGQLVLYLLDCHLLFLQLCLKLRQHFPQRIVPCLVNNRQPFQCVPLVRTKHLTLAADRLRTILAKVVDLHFVGLTNFLLHLLINQLIDNTHELVDESVAAGHHGHPFDLLPAMRALGLEQQASPDAPLAVQLRAEWAHHGAIGVAEADVTSQQLLQLVPRVLSRVLDLLLRADLSLGLLAGLWLCD